MTCKTPKPCLVEKALKRRKVVKAYMDSLYDSSRTYEYVEAKGIKAVVKPRGNSRAEGAITPGAKR